MGILIVKIQCNYPQCEKGVSKNNYFFIEVLNSGYKDTHAQLLISFKYTYTLLLLNR